MICYGGSLPSLTERIRWDGRKKTQMLDAYGFLGWILIGLLAGALAKWIMPGKNPGGCLVTVLLGIAGALLAGFVGNAVGWYSQGQAGGFIAATLGALVILWLYRVITRRR
jgi:uncharacterized membrane protein YeaQ/YmgE (transglycosylase-associated protein family)